MKNHVPRASPVAEDQLRREEHNTHIAAPSADSGATV